jgi:two-component system, sensor histidine kinase and response regulator
VTKPAARFAQHKRYRGGHGLRVIAAALLWLLVLSCGSLILARAGNHAIARLQRSDVRRLLYARAAYKYASTWSGTHSRCAAADNMLASWRCQRTIRAEQQVRTHYRAVVLWSAHALSAPAGETTGPTAARHEESPQAITMVGTDTGQTALWYPGEFRAFAMAAVGLLVAILLIQIQRRRRRSDPRDLAAILNALPSMIGYWNADLRNRFANNAYSSWLGAGSAPLPGTHIRTFHGDELYARIAPHVETVLRGQPVSFEQTIAGHSGARAAHFLVHYVPDFQNGAVRGFYALQHDVTETTEAKYQLAALVRENEGLLSTLRQHAPVSVADADGKITDANHAFCAISGYSREELLGQDHRLVSSNTHPASFWNGLWGSVGKGTPWRGEICNRAKGGALYWVDSIIAPFLGENGQVVKYISLLHDITARKEAKRLLIESEAFLERVEEVSGVGGFRFNFDDGAIQWTRQTYRLHEIAEGRIPTQELIDRCFAPEINRQLREATFLAREAGTGYDFEVPMKTASDQTIWLRMVGKVECDGGAPIRVIGTIQDITERRAMNQQLQDATAVAQRANRAKSEFLANMSHEIRTPLNAIIGLGYLLEQTTLSEDQRQFLIKIQFAGRALLGVINNVLDLSKIEAGEMVLEEELFNLPELVEDLCQMMVPQASSKGIELIGKMATNVPPMVKGDASRLRQVLTNLLSNSIKFTQVGQVNMDLSVSDSGPQSVRLRCEVKDTGIGIEPEALGRMFTPFTQADASTTRRFGGTGLGLSIARRFVELMGGEIGVSSVPATGSTFWIEVPLRLLSATDNAGTANRARGLRISVANSGGDAPGGLGAMVRALGWIPRVAASCEPVLQFIDDSQPDAWPDVLILDVRVLDGPARQSISEHWKQDNGDDYPPIIFVADDSRSPAASEPLMRGSDILLARPVTSSALFNAINTAVWKRRDGGERVLRSTTFDEQHAQWLAGVHVLAVDDSDINLEVARRILEKQGAIVTSCSDGEAAFQCVRETHKQLDIVLMDVQMPILDGNEATRRIRHELKLADLPILALTAGALLGERQKSLEAGMNDFVTKPFDPQALIRKVRRLVEQARGAPIPMVMLQRNSVRRAAGWPSISSIDSDAIHQLFGGDLALFSSLLVRVLREYSAFEVPCSVSPDNDDSRTALRERAHKLKGSAGVIGATGLRRLAGAVERALIENRPSGVVERILKQLASDVATLRAESLPFLKIHEAQKINVGPVASEDVENGTAGMDELCSLLDHHNLAAVEAFNALGPRIAAMVSPERLGRLRAAIDDLDFPLGAQLLREARLKEAASKVDG